MQGIKLLIFAICIAGIYAGCTTDKDCPQDYSSGAGQYCDVGYVWNSCADRKTNVGDSCGDEKTPGIAQCGYDKNTHRMMYCKNNEECQPHPYPDCRMQEAGKVTPSFKCRDDNSGKGYQHFNVNGKDICLDRCYGGTGMTQTNGHTVFSCNGKTCDNTGDLYDNENFCYYNFDYCFGLTSQSSTESDSSGSSGSDSSDTSNSSISSADCTYNSNSGCNSTQYCDEGWFSNSCAEKHYVGQSCDSDKSDQGNQMCGMFPDFNMGGKNRQLYCNDGTCAQYPVPSCRMIEAGKLPSGKCRDDDYKNGFQHVDDKDNNKTYCVDRCYKVPGYMINNGDLTIWCNQGDYCTNGEVYTTSSTESDTSIPSSGSSGNSLFVTGMVGLSVVVGLIGIGFLMAMVFKKKQNSLEEPQLTTLEVQQGNTYQPPAPIEINDPAKAQI